MSMVTSVIPGIDILVPISEVQKKLDSYFVEEIGMEGIRFVNLLETELPCIYSGIRPYGGNKVLQMHVLTAAINHLNVEEFLRFLQTEIPWPHPKACGAMILLDQDSYPGFLYPAVPGEIDRFLTEYRGF